MEHVYEAPDPTTQGNLPGSDADKWLLTGKNIQLMTYFLALGPISFEIVILASSKSYLRFQDSAVGDAGDRSEGEGEWELCSDITVKMGKLKSLNEYMMDRKFWGSLIYVP